MIKFNKVFNLIFIITFLCQNTAFCLPKESPVLRVPIKGSIRVKKGIDALKPNKNTVHREMPYLDEFVKKHEVSQMPAGTILETLGIDLDRPDYIEGASFISETNEGELTIRRFKWNKKPNLSFLFKGVDLLVNEIINISNTNITSIEFELIFDRRGYVIGILPIVPQEVIEMGVPIKDLRLAWLDLTLYYFDLEAAQPGKPGAEAKWTSLFKEKAYLSELLLQYKNNILYPTLPNDTVKSTETLSWPYVSLEVTPEGKWYTKDVTQKDFSFRPHNPSSHFIIISTFPTVYSPVGGNSEGSNAASDRGYYECIISEKDIRPGDKIEVRGPGSGSDCYVAWLKTQSTVYAVAKTELEAANARYTAKIAGFDLVCNTEDFPGETFDWVFWNMPNYVIDGISHTHLRGADVWDFDSSGEALREFARTLPGILKEDGNAIIWNRTMRMHPGRGPKVIPEDEQLSEIEKIINSTREHGEEIFDIDKIGYDTFLISRADPDRTARKAAINEVSRRFVLSAFMGNPQKDIIDELLQIASPKVLEYFRIHPHGGLIVREDHKTYKAYTYYPYINSRFKKPVVVDQATFEAGYPLSVPHDSRMDI